MGALGMTPTEYEELVAETYRREGWSVRLTPATGDHGVDVFADKGDERLAIQVKMYGGTTRRISRAMVMQLHGATAYFDCSRSVIVTDGLVTPDAEQVASKLGVEIRAMVPDRGVMRSTGSREIRRSGSTAVEFDEVWERYVMPLRGTELRRPGGAVNEVIAVDWGGLTRRTSNGRVQHITIEIFRVVIRRILEGEVVTRAWINDEYPDRASSGIVLILSHVPIFELVDRPMALRLATPRS